jgi:hypothetical protein
MISRTKKLNEHLKDPEDFAVGTQVLLRKHNSLLKKFESPYRELYEVIENKGQGAYKIRNRETHTEYYVNRKDIIPYENGIDSVSEEGSMLTSI